MILGTDKTASDLATFLHATSLSLNKTEFITTIKNCFFNVSWTHKKTSYQTSQCPISNNSWTSKTKTL